MTKCSNYPALESMCSPPWHCFASPGWQPVPVLGPSWASRRAWGGWGELPSIPQMIAGKWFLGVRKGLALRRAGCTPLLGDRSGSRGFAAKLAGAHPPASSPAALTCRASPLLGQGFAPLPPPRGCGSSSRERGWGSSRTCLAINSAGKAGAAQLGPAAASSPTPQAAASGSVHPWGWDLATPLPPCDTQTPSS